MGDQAEKPTACVVPDCSRDVEFDSPNYLCATHWDAWWNWPEGKEDPPWSKRKHDESKGAPVNG